MIKLIITCLLVAMGYAASAQLTDTVVIKGTKLIVTNDAETRPEPTFQMIDFLGKNVNYTEFARENGIQGKVYVKFSIDELGKASFTEIVASPDTSLSNEVVRVINKMPPWKPAMKDGRPVVFFIVMPISFRIEDKKHKKQWKEEYGD